MMIVAVFYIHLEVVDREAVWWAETPAVPGLSVAAATLKELRSLVAEAGAAHLPGDRVEFQLVADEPPTANPASVVTDEPISRGVEVRRLVAVA